MEMDFSERAVAVFRECALIPTLSRAHIFPNEDGCVEVEVTWSQRDLERGRNVAFTESYFLKRTPNTFEVLCSSTFQGCSTQM